MKNKKLQKLYDCLLILFSALTAICVVIGPFEDNMEILIGMLIISVWAFLVAGKYLMNLAEHLANYSACYVEDGENKN